jgi:hypothetical protein
MRALRLFFAAFFVFAAVGLAQQPTQWVQGFPSQGYASSIPFKAVAASADVMVGVSAQKDGISVSQNGVDWVNLHEFETGFLGKIVYGDAGFVAVGQDGEVLHSINGYRWKKYPKAISMYSTSLIWTGQVYLAIGGNNTLHRSINGTNWSSMDLSPIGDGRILFRRGAAVCMTTTNKGCLISHDQGLTWSEVEGAPALNFSSGAEGVGGSLLVYSPQTYFWADDGTWTQTDTPGLAPLGNMGSRMLAKGTGNGVYVSENGVNWTPMEIDWEPFLAPGQKGTTQLVEFKGRHFLIGSDGSVAVAESGPGFLTAPLLEGKNYGCKDLVSTNGVLYAVGQYGFVYPSVDGITWGQTNGVYRSDNLMCAAATHGDEWIAVGEYGKIWKMDAAGSITSSALSGGNLRGITASDARYVAVGDSGVIHQMPHGGAWASTTAPTSANLHAVAHGDGAYIAVGAGGTIARSADGTSWTIVPSGTAKDLNSVAYAMGRWIAVGADGTLLHSADGINWTTTAAGPGVSLNKVISFQGSVYVMGNHGYIARSPDLSHWSVIKPAHSGYDVQSAVDHEGELVFLVAKGFVEGRTICSDPRSVVWKVVSDIRFRSVKSPMGLLYSVHQFKGLLLVGGPQGLILTSTDARNWQSQIIPEAGNVRSIESTPDLCVIGTSGGLYYSTDGLTWQAASIQIHGSGECSNIVPPSSVLTVVRGPGNKWIATGTNTILISHDGKSWFKPVLPFPVLSEIVRGSWDSNGAVFVSGGTVYHSTDGTTWTEATHPNASLPIGRKRIGNRFYTATVHERIASTEDGVSWEYHSANRDLYGPIEYHDIAAYNGGFVAVGKKGVISTSPDGRNWTYESGEWFHRFTNVTRTGDRFTILGSSGNLFTTKDGRRITKIHTGSEAEFIYGARFAAVASNGSGAVAVGNTIMISADLDTWTEIGNPVEEELRTVIWDGSKYMAGGASGAVLTSPDGAVWTQVANIGWEIKSIAASPNGYSLATPYTHYTSGDGITWIKHATTPSPFGRMILWDGIQYIAANSTFYLMTSPDGVVWTHTSARVPRSPIAYTNGNLLSAGLSGSGGPPTFFHSTDGQNWTDLHVTRPEHIKGLAGSEDQWIAVYEDGRIMVSSKSDFPPLRDDLLARGASLTDDFTMNGDANEDGVPNLIAYYFGLPVTHGMAGAGREALPTYQHSGDSPGIFRFTLPGSVPPYLDLCVEESGDLSHWREVARRRPSGIWSGEYDVTESPSEQGRHTIEVSTGPPVSEESRFYRVNLREVQ